MLGAPVNRRIAYLAALISFGVKGVCAFAITYLLARTLSFHDFGLWSTMFSIGTVLGVSELGVGQLILTTFHETKIRGAEADRLVTNAVAAMSALSVALLIVISFAFSWFHVLDDLRWRALLLATILVRLVVVPHGAYLSALERYHERKIAEAVSFLASAVFIYWGVSVKADLSMLLIGMNAIVTVGACGVAVRAVQLGMPRVRFSDIVPAQIRTVFATSFPYFVSNVSSLATYGGFIALSSMILPAAEIARLALLHNMLLMHVMQIGELVFRSLQPRMRDAALMRKLELGIAGTCALGLTVAVTAGSWLFSQVFKKYEYSRAELAVYVIFVFLEVLFLLLTSAMQMRSAHRLRLQWLSLLKAGAFLVVLGLAAMLWKTPTILSYAALLVVYSAGMAGLTWHYEHRDPEMVR